MSTWTDRQTIITAIVGIKEDQTAHLRVQWIDHPDECSSQVPVLLSQLRQGQLPIGVIAKRALYQTQ